MKMAQTLLRYTGHNPNAMEPVTMGQKYKECFFLRRRNSKGSEPLHHNIENQSQAFFFIFS